jgi:hypothetical protein
VTFVLAGVVRSTGAVMAPVLILAIAMWGIRVPVARWLQPVMGVDAIWWSFPISSVCSMLMMLAYYRWGNWRKATCCPPAGRAGNHSPRKRREHLRRCRCTAEQRQQLRAHCHAGRSRWSAAQPRGQSGPGCGQVLKPLDGRGTHTDLITADHTAAVQEPKYRPRLLPTSCSLPLLHAALARRLRSGCLAFDSFKRFIHKRHSRNSAQNISQQLHRPGANPACAGRTGGPGPRGNCRRPGFWLGLKLAHEPDWHTYWKNAGDSGLPTELQWQLPSGWRRQH